MKIMGEFTHATATKSMSIRCVFVSSIDDNSSTYIMAIQVVEFSNGGYKIRKVFA